VRALVLKLSGEVLGGAGGAGLDPKALEGISAQIAEVLSEELKLGIVVGAGNFVRGGELAEAGFPRERADILGMLCTVVNGLALQSSLLKQGVKAAVLSAFAVEGAVEQYSEQRLRALQEQVVIFVGGTGNPFFTTDTTAALRACQMGAELLLKGTKVDGVYSADPVKDSRAELFRHLTYEEVLRSGLQVMDLTAITLCKERRLPIRVFNMTVPGNLAKVLRGEPLGSLIGPARAEDQPV